MTKTPSGMPTIYADFPNPPEHFIGEVGVYLGNKKYSLIWHDEKAWHRLDSAPFASQFDAVISIDREARRINFELWQNQSTGV